MYLPRELGVAGFFHKLNTLNVDYIVLRWFDDLPNVKPNEDIDMLVDDGDLEKTRALLKGLSLTGEIPCDIYSCGGLPGSDFRGLPYFPVKKANEVLRGSLINQNGVKVPSDFYHLLTMIYHILYHKGFNSGIASLYKADTSYPAPDHDYEEVLTNIAQKANLCLPEMTLENLESFLSEQGWVPEADTLKKLSKRNNWIKKHYFDSEQELDPHLKGFGVFIIREKGLQHLEQIKKIVWEQGFTLVFEKPINASKMSDAAESIRGGNWNKGPWPKSGGLPAYVLAVNDCSIIDPAPHIKQNHPGITNARVYLTKNKIRHIVNKQHRKANQFNVVHSADNAVESFLYAELLFPEEIGRIKTLIQKEFDGFKTPYPVVKSLSNHARRAKIELVRYNNSYAICKTFKPGRERFLRREILARELSGSLSHIMDIIEEGPNYIITKYYENKLPEKCFVGPFFSNTRFIPPFVLKTLRSTIRHYRQYGYECIDLSPKNVILDSEGSIKVYDFEFLQKWNKKTSSLKGSFAFTPVPSDFKGDLPSHKNHYDPFFKNWFKLTGVPRLFLRYNVPSGLIITSQLLSATLLSLLFLFGHTRSCVKKTIQGLKTRLRLFITSSNV